MSTEIAIALIVMLVLLFIKVPVFLSVIGGSAVYFLMNPDVGSLIWDSAWCPPFRTCRCWRSRFSSAPACL